MLWSNGIIKLGLVKFFVLYCSGTQNIFFKSIQNLVIGFQINFLGINPNEVDHLKVLRGGIQKSWEFDLP